MPALHACRSAPGAGGLEILGEPPLPPPLPPPEFGADAVVAKPEGDQSPASGCALLIVAVLSEAGPNTSGCAARTLGLRRGHASLRLRLNFRTAQRQRSGTARVGLAGVRVLVALGSRLRGNDEGGRVLQQSCWGARAGCAGFPPSRERRGGAGSATVLLACRRRWVPASTALGLQRSPSRERRAAAGTTGGEVLQRSSWGASVGCAGFPPSRERREAAGSATVLLGGACRLRWVPAFGDLCITAQPAT